MDVEELLALIARRPAGTEGIALASRYVNAIGSCMGDADCADRFFSMGTPAAWADQIKAAGRVLVYNNADMAAVGGVGLGEKAWGDQHAAWAKKWEAAKLTAKACMDFTCIATSRSKDRDADVLEPDGALPDPNAVLLWQHIQLQPIGRVLEWGASADGLIPARASIVDNELGRDAALLVEFKALKISHGFLPLQFEPLKGDKNRDKVDPRLGWLVKRFKILELSLVSVQSNEDAIITAWSREKLHHPLVKNYADQLHAMLPKSLRVGWDGASTPAPIHLHVEIGAPNSAGRPAAAKSGDGACGCGGQTAADSPAASATTPAADGKATTEGNKCPDCGVKLDEQDKCPKCGKVTKPKAGRPAVKALLTVQEVARRPDGATGGRKGDGTFTGGPGVPMPFLEDSWEDTQADLESTAMDWLKRAGVVSGYGYGGAILLGTFDDHAVVCVRSYDSSDRGVYSCWQGRWQMGAGNEPEWSGQPESVDLTVNHVGPTGEPPNAAGQQAARQKALAGLWTARQAGKAASADECGRQLLTALRSDASMDPDAADYLAAVLTARAADVRRTRDEKALAALLAG